MTDKKGPPTSFDRFRELTGKLIKVPKPEADAKEAAYQRKKAKRRRKQS